MNKTSLALVLALSTPALPATALAETCRSDQGHTEVFFGWNHAGVSRQYGEFTQSMAVLAFDGGDIENATLTAHVETASAVAGFGPMDDMLRSRSFLWAEEFPQITFVSTGVQKTSETTAVVTGNLTIRDVTREFNLDVTLTHHGEHPLRRNFPDYYGGQWLAFEAIGEVRSYLFNVGNNPTLGLKGPISIEIRTELQCTK